MIKEKKLIISALMMIKGLTYLKQKLFGLISYIVWIIAVETFCYFFLFFQ